MNPLARQRDGPGEARIKTGHQQLLVKQVHRRDDENRDTGHQLDVVLPDRRRLAEHKLVDAALVAGWQSLNHRQQADAHGKKRGQRQAKRSVLLDPGRLPEVTHEERADEPGEHRADENESRVFPDGTDVEIPVQQAARIDTGKQKTKRHAWQHCVRQGVANQRHLANDDKAAKQAARDAQKHRPGDGVAHCGIAERQEPQSLLTKRGFLRHVTDLRRPGAFRQQQAKREQAKRERPAPALGQVLQRRRHVS